MQTIKFFICLIVFSLSSEIRSQNQDIIGAIKASGDVFGIHIVNKTSNTYAISNDEGIFEISAKLNDVVIVSGIQYIPLEIVITDIIIQTKQLVVNLDDNVTLLNEVTVGKILTGDLMSDIENSESKRDLNFYDLGIPGYTGKRATQSERRLYEAKSGSGLVPLNPIINWISGRTKQLKEQIVREEINIAVEDAFSTYAALVFEAQALDETMQKQFFHFCSDDPSFLPLSKTRNELKMLEFLKLKLVAFNLQIEEN